MVDFDSPDFEFELRERNRDMRRQEARRRLARGQSVREVASGMGCCANTVQALKREMGIPSNAEMARRAMSGESHHRAVLTVDDVRQIRSMYAGGGWTERQLAAHFGVSRGAINWVLERRTWRHVTE